ncbi:hypothetical protein [Oleiharenicola lentus]|uniref:hypothetical protein n=1 Tax=Oleiharenicola lentus TaxID=2508720 RepID=UPI003F66F86D
MRYYCTYFDQNYLTRGLALYDSLIAQAGDFELSVLCMDDPAHGALQENALPGVRLLKLSELVASYPELAAARDNRSKLEFYFTCTSWLMKHLLKQLPAGDLLTYLDADMYFFGSPQPVYDEIGSASVAITPHRFPATLSHLERYGRFNVGWVSFCNDATGQACATDWADKCAAWCFNELDGDRYADQKYLDAWAAQFPHTVSITHPGVNAAPWNVKDAFIAQDGSGVSINGHPLVLYHFHALNHLGQQLYDPSLHKYDAVLTAGLRDIVYLPYLQHLLRHQIDPAQAPELIPPVRADDPRNSLVIPYLLERLQKSELDRAKRLDYVHVVEKDRDQARAEQDQTVNFLRSVEKDSADRLASIVFHQDKLKTAYADLERNVAYLKMLEAEIAAHVKVSADKDAIIADLAQKLQMATASRPTSP